LLDVVFASDVSKEEVSPPFSKVRKTSQGLFVQSIKNLRLQLIRKSNPLRYEISKVGAYRVAPGSTVYFAERSLFQQQDHAHAQVRLHFTGSNGLSLAALAQAAAFGPSVLGEDSEVGPSKGAVHVVLPTEEHSEGCEPYTLDVGTPEDSVPPRKAVLIRRGTCSFSTKVAQAARAGAKAVLVINSDESTFTPTADEADLDADEATEAIPLLLLSNSTGTMVSRMVAASRTHMQVVGAAPKAVLQTDQEVFTINGLVVSNAEWAGPDGHR
jgi:hypothetical protein